MLGVALLPFGGLRDVVPSPILAGAAFLALLAATLIGGIEGWSTRGGRRSQQQAAEPSAVPGAGIWPRRIGLAFVGLIAAIAAQSWFDPGRLLRRGQRIARPCGHGLAGAALRSVVMVGLRSRQPSS